MTNRSWVAQRRVLISGLLVAGLGGCSSSPASKPLSPQSFYPGQRRIEEDPRREFYDTKSSSGVTFPAPQAQDPLPAPKVVPATRPATQPAAELNAQPATSTESLLPPGQYQLIGSVVAEVNGTPIYANKVLSLINKPLMQKAREMKPAAFRAFAAGLIDKQVQELVNDELLFAAAERALSDDDKKLVDNVTLQWRTTQITQAGGSLQIARSKAAADGDDFDELARQQYRKNMIDIYRYRKLTPRIQVTIDDLRRYYDKHQDSDYTVHAAARFRLLEVSVRKSGSREHALERVTRMYQKITNGEDDFTAMCGSENDDSLLARNKGDLGMKEKGSLPKALSKVEDEIWKLQPGKMTDIIDTGDAFYIAKLEEVRPGHVRPFNEQPNGDVPSVQEEIKSKLQKEQFRDLSVEIDNRLRKNSYIRTDKSMMNLCLDMAMQRYAAVAQR